MKKDNCDVTGVLKNQKYYREVCPTENNVVSDAESQKGKHL